MIQVIYQSTYGYTQQYGQWIAEELDAPLCTLNEVKSEDIEAAQCIIFGSSVYAGKFQKIDRLKKWVEDYPDKEFIFFGVCIADTDHVESKDYLLSRIQASLGPDVYQKVQVYLLRGGLDYGKLNLLHRLMMWMMMRMIKGKKDKSLQDQVLLDTYGQKIDFIDRSAIKPLIEYVISKQGALSRH